MRKRIKTALQTVAISAFAVACISSAIYWIKKDEERAPRISFEQLDHAPVNAAILPLQNHDIVYVKCVFKNAGTLNNSLENHGISNIVAELLLKHIEGMSADDTLDKFVELGARELNVNASGDDFELSFYVQKEKAKELFAVLNKAFVNPSFSEGDLSKAKDNIPTVLSPETASAHRLMRAKVLEELFGTNCAYGLRSAGTAQAIGGITADDVKSFIQQKLSRKNLRILIVGDVTSMTARQYLDIFLKDIAEGTENPKIMLGSDSFDTDSGQVSQNSAKFSYTPSRITKPNMEKTAAFLVGVRLDNLSDVEKAALYIIQETLFGSEDSDFIDGFKKAGIVSNCYYEIIERSYSYVMLVLASVDIKDSELYIKYFNEKMAKYGDADFCRGPILDKFMDTKKYLLKLSDNGFYNLTDIDDQIRRAYLPYEKVTEKVLKNMLRKMFGAKGLLKFVMCSK